MRLTLVKLLPSSKFLAYRYLSASLAMAITLTGCSPEQMRKEDIGTGVGVLAGALLGNKVGGGAKGAIIGALVGGLAGKMIGASLDEADRKALAQHTARNLDSLKPGQSANWQSARTGSSATLRVAQEGVRQKPVNIKTVAVIDVPPDLTLMSQLHVTKKPTDIYTSVGANAQVVGKLAKGKTTRVTGKTSDGQWLLVSRKGTLIGFVRASDAKKYVPAKAAPSARPDAAVADLDAMSAKEIRRSDEGGPVDLDALPAVERATTAAMECKTIVYDINSQGAKSQESAEACKTASGTWELG